MLNRSGPNTDPLGPPHFTVFQVEE